jgi:hypothetical protein
MAGPGRLAPSETRPVAMTMPKNAGARSASALVARSRCASRRRRTVGLVGTEVVAWSGALRMRKQTPEFRPGLRAGGVDSSDERAVDEQVAPAVTGATRLAPRWQERVRPRPARVWASRRRGWASAGAGPGAGTGAAGGRRRFDNRRRSNKIQTKYIFNAAAGCGRCRGRDGPDRCNRSCN